MIDYKFNEDVLLDEIRQYIDSTYAQHYSNNKLQATEVIMDNGHGEGFCLGNALKYILRAKHKESYIEDIKKAHWYLEYLIQRSEGGK